MIAFAHDNLITALYSNNKDNEWYTPAYVIEAAREVMNGIDLDPASSKEANKVVKAGMFLTQHDNGLNHRWYGNVWLNPPFMRDNVGDSRFGGGKSRMGIWVTKLVEEYKQGHIEQAVLLTTNKADISWFDQLWEYTICFTTKRVLFTRPGYPKEHNKQGHFFGTIFVYFGKNEQRFIEIFSKFGPVIPANTAIRQQSAVQTLGLWEGIA